MIVVWGVKQKRKTLGLVAEACKTCRGIDSHRFVEVREVPHLYYIPFGRGKIAEYQVECAGCASATTAETERYAAMLDEEIPLEKLISLTNPGVLAELEEQKEREERAQRGEVTPEERLQVMMESLYTVMVAAEERVAARSIDARTGGILAATFVLSVGLFVSGLSPDAPERGMILVWASGITMVGGIIASIHAGVTNVKRYICRTQGEAIYTALQPFNPSPAELKELAGDLRAAGSALGKHLDVTWLTELFYSAGALSR